ncbi:uncharacterized protein LOC116145065, partial [Pistacia vera]|uniref:uncharacterized protein LOC116145065 n=1 Tax=Pistacia vera TaxID=55513 RepID=UPI0012631A90
MIFKVATLLLILLCVSSRNNGVVASLPGEEEELQILKKSDNVKTIQLESGDIVDCVDIYKQPAFSHPSLKNHKIQVLPKSYLARREKQLQELRLKGKACPHGTVPIPRTTKQESVIARALNPTTISAANNNSPPQVLPKSYLPRRKKQLQELRLKGKARPLETVP